MVSFSNGKVQFWWVRLVANNWLQAASTKIAIIVFCIRACALFKLKILPLSYPFCVKIG